MANEIHVGDIGTTFRFSIVDAGAAFAITGSTIVARFRKSSGAIQRTCTITNGAGGVCEYVTITGDIDADGPWSVQITITTASSQVWHSDWHNFTVYPNV